MFPMVRAERARAGLTLEQVAKELNIQPTTLSFKLNGKAPLTFAEAVKIKQILGSELPLEILFKMEVPK